MKTESAGPHSRIAAAVGAAVALLLAGAGELAAINYGGDRANGCVAVGAGNTHVITLNNGTSVGNTILVSGFISANGAEAATPISDTRANTWTKAFSYVATNGGRLFLFETRVTAGKTHTAGDTITLAYSGASGQESCAVVSIFVGLAVPSSADRTAGASGSSMAPSATAGGPTSQASELLMGTFGFVAATGGFSYVGSLQPLSGACSAPYCMFPGYQILSSTTTPTAAGSTVNTTSWGAILVTFKADNTIFNDGFENQTTNNWSAVAN
jgi:hypothetical protein